MSFRPKTAVAWLMMSGATLFATSAYAETTLRALDGSFEMQGSSVTFDEQNFFLETSQGQMIVRREFVSCIGDDCPPEDVIADVDPEQQVELASLDGTFQLVGKLLDATETDFVIQTGGGSVTVRREFVTCNGGACPSTEVPLENLVVAVEDQAGADLLTTVINDFAESKDFSTTQSAGAAGTFASVLVGDARGAEVANVAMTEYYGIAAIHAVILQDAAFALTQTRITAEELADMTGAPVEDIGDVLTETTIGLDALSFVIHPNNRINVLNLTDLQAVMSGGVSNWSDLGGADQPINVHLLSGDTSLSEQLSARLLEDAAPSSDHQVHATATALNAAVNADENALGVVFQSQASDLKTVDLAGACNIFFDNSAFSIQTEEYPLTVRWYHYALATGNQSEIARNIGDFMVTDAGQQSIASRGLIPQKLRVLPIKDQGARLLTAAVGSGASEVINQVARSYLAEVSTAERLSTALRFLTGEAELDGKAIDDIKRISSVVRSTEYEGYEVLVFGFTDSVGTVAANLALSTRRAQAVKDILLAENIGFLDDDRVNVFGMGPIAPVNCNDTATGRDLNRRVEIWIRPRA